MRHRHSVLHVRCADAGKWVVHFDDESEPLSEHVTATDATRCAFELAFRGGLTEVVVHDAYDRCRTYPLTRHDQTSFAHSGSPR